MEDAQRACSLGQQRSISDLLLDDISEDEGWRQLAQSSREGLAPPGVKPSGRVRHLAASSSEDEPTPPQFLTVRGRGGCHTVQPQPGAAGRITTWTQHTLPVPTGWTSKSPQSLPPSLHSHRRRGVRPSRPQQQQQGQGLAAGATETPRNQVLPHLRQDLPPL